MNEDDDKSDIIKFKSDVKVLKIPKNYDAMSMNEEEFVEFLVLTE